jgi:hypothetical protein
MTLSEMASFVCTKMMDTEDASVTVCKNFIKRRYQMIWDSAIWTESLGTVSQAVLTDTAEVTISSNPQVFYYPTSSTTIGSKMDFVVAAKFVPTGEEDGHETIGSDWATFFQVDPGIFENTVSRRNFPSNFANLPKDASGNCRIRLIPATSTAGSLFALGKLKLTNLTDDDTPVIRGIDNALLAFSEGDMYERSRQFAKSQVKFAEAASQIQIMRDLEKGQQQCITRIIPVINDEYSVSDIY